MKKDIQKTIKIKRPKFDSCFLAGIIMSLTIITPFGMTIDKYIIRIEDIQLFEAIIRTLLLGGLLLIITDNIKWLGWVNLSEGIVDWKQVPVEGTASFSSKITIVVEDGEMVRLEKELAVDKLDQLSVISS